MSKTCTKCGKIKYPHEFYKWQLVCKECAREKARLYQEIHRKNPDFVKKHREAYKNWYENNGRNRAVDYKEAIKEWRVKHPEALKAHYIVQKAIKETTMIRPVHCTECKLNKRVSAHHDDYSKPLEVIWLCSSCHKLRHLQG